MAFEELRGTAENFGDWSLHSKDFAEKHRIQLEDCSKIFQNPRNNNCFVWEDIKGLDSQIRMIKQPDKKKGDELFEVEIGLFESLGEQGGDVITEFFDTIPTREEIRRVTREHLQLQKKEFSETDIHSGREEMQMGALKKLMI